MPMYEYRTDTWNSIPRYSYPDSRISNLEPSPNTKLIGPPTIKSFEYTGPHKSSQCYDVQPNSSQRFPLSIKFSVSFQRQNPIYQIIYQIIFQIILENLPTSPIDFDHPKTIHWKRKKEVWPCSVQEIEMPTRPTTTTITSKIQ